MKKLSLALLFLTITFNVSAAYESLCWDNDCKTHGWTEKSENTEIDYQCLRGNCEENGVVRGNFDIGSYIICKNSSCNTAGSYELKRSNQMKIAETFCNQNDCTQFGSVTYSAKGTLSLICKNNDCNHSGWISEMNGSVVEEVVCLNNDCAHFGWRNIR
jgi:hypothetical protein